MLTNADGSYSFGDLRPGTYTVTETTQPAGKLDGKDTAGTAPVGGAAGTAGNEVISAIVLPAGGASVNNNFGEIKPAVISGFVYCDDNNDGIQETGEVGLAGVTVTLTGTNDQGAITPISVLTNADGSYSFGDLRPGTYTVTETTQPAGKLDGKETAGSTGGNTTVNEVISGVTVGSGQTSAGNNFGEIKPGSISGFVYCDTNNDGVKDGGELGLGGVTVTLTGSNDQGAITPISVLTNADGSYSFGDLRPGTYTVTETTQPAGKLDGKDTAGTAPVGGAAGTAGNEVISAIVLPAGGASVNNNFGEIKPAVISGFVYCDDNNNGIQESGEVGLAGVTVTLTGTNDQGAITPISVLTNADGSYSFGDLRPGTYTVTETTQPAGKLDGKETAGSTGGNTTVNEVISGVTVGSGQTSAGNNFGEIKPGSISGFVYCDTNNDGVKDGGELGLGGVTVTLTGSNDQGAITPISVLTNADGSYSFGDLRPGTYTVTETTQPAGKLDGKDTAGTAPVGGAAGTAGNEVISAIVLPAGGASVNNNFGEIKPAVISGFVYCDDNNNGIQESGEVGLAGVTVTLTGTNDQGAITPISVLTNADGSYSFGDLRPGTYTVTETTQPAGKLDGKETAGSTGGNTTVNEVISGVTVGSGQTSSGNNFGEIKPGSISGFVYCDTNNDGVKDGGELGLGGVTVTLTGTNDQGAITPISVLTNADGSYSFGDLRPGTYTVTETTQPAGKLDGKDTAGTAPVGGAAGTAGNEVISAIVLPAGGDEREQQLRRDQAGGDQRLCLLRRQQRRHPGDR